MKILALCGSLRSESRSAALLRAAKTLAPLGVDFQIFDGHGQLPLFNPELEPYAPVSVKALWDAVTAADAVVIASPEYAHGVTGTIKNTLDWLVGHIPFAYKPVAVFNPSFQSYHADEALKETLRTMAADLIPDACVRIPVIGSGISPEDIATTTNFSSILESALQAIISHVQAQNQPREA
ncbi:NADPH-dependent FMN reductase [Thermomonas sp. HDW16]|uniref:NADPH-dependent FMN reductase n=1 Tax=Thermomonas sp. HDW16 TaxID=2714945 RepID=UPI00140DC079|nr:NADPH-dependent FMN reductase [Thermomonas sp. HDW16]QIL21067.1 NAD(P)H-dependent oxidoreductase [Thermomonas sp. HDW16]QIL21069.1 NAD(P)H-dependent oxidoreductase [Thermomonas sp. HDW16]